MQSPIFPKQSTSFCKDIFRNKGEGLLFFFFFFQYILFQRKGKYICLTGTSNIIRYKNISLITMVLRRYELFTSSGDSLCAGISCDINFCLQLNRGILLPRLLKSKNACNFSFSKKKNRRNL